MGIFSNTEKQSVQGGICVAIYIASKSCYMCYFFLQAFFLLASVNFVAKLSFLPSARTCTCTLPLPLLFFINKIVASFHLHCISPLSLVSFVLKIYMAPKSKHQYSKGGAGGSSSGSRRKVQQVIIRFCSPFFYFRTWWYIYNLILLILNYRFPVNLQKMISIWLQRTLGVFVVRGVLPTYIMGR